MASIYLVLFFAGVAFAVLSVVIGDIFHIDGGGHLPYLSPTTMSAFATVFGGCGYFLMANTSWSGIFIAVISLFAAVTISTALFFFVVLPLEKAHKNTAGSAKDMIGRTAEVVTAIAGRTKGEIIYEQGGVRFNAPAMARLDEILTQGERVVIVDEIGGTFIVAKQETKAD